MVTTASLLKAQRRGSEPCPSSGRVVPPHPIMGALPELALGADPEIYVVVPSDVPCVAGEKRLTFRVSFSARHAAHQISARDPGSDLTLNPEILSRPKNVLEEALRMSTAAK